MVKIRIRDLGWKKVGFGIRDKHPGSATLIVGRYCICGISRVHTEWRMLISGVHFIMMEKSALAGERVTGCTHAQPLSEYYHHVQSCSVRSC
jgi:hypothetical protein